MILGNANLQSVDIILYMVNIINLYFGCFEYIKIWILSASKHLLCYSNNSVYTILDTWNCEISNFPLDIIVFKHCKFILWMFWVQKILDVKDWTHNIFFTGIRKIILYIHVYISLLGNIITCYSIILLLLSIQRLECNVLC